MSGETAPNSTVYVSNLYEKLKKEGAIQHCKQGTRQLSKIRTANLATCAAELKQCLYAVFSQFGKILDVICMKTYRLRGQAWVVFSDVTSATNALTSMQGFPFFDKPMRLQYAHSESDATAKFHGRTPNKPLRTANDTTARGARKLQENAGTAVGPSSTVQASGKAAIGGEPPNKILFVQNLPAATNDQMLGMLFQQFPGFREVRMVEARPGIAFVEFENDMQASVAMTGLQSFKITPTNAMNVSYAKQ